MQVDEGVLDRLADLLGEERRQLAAILTTPGKFYHREQRKKDDGRRRLLLVPDEGLRAVQRKVLSRVLTQFRNHPCSHCRKERSIITNAAAHIGRPFVSVCDVANCFPSVSDTVVARALSCNKVPAELVGPLTSLCTFRHQLPQGAPTSNSILNAVFHPLDERLCAAAAAKGVVYTRYVDDLTFSGHRQIRRFVNGTVVTALHASGFQLAHGKTHHWGRRQVPVITGVEVSASLGPRKALVRMVERQIDRISPSRPVTGKEMCSLLGKIAWIHQLWPRKARSLYDRVAGLSPSALSSVE